MVRFPGDDGMSGWQRIAIMVVVSGITLTIIGAGFDAEGMGLVGSYVLFFCTLPLILLIAIFNALEKWLGLTGTVLIALVGLLPTAFLFWIAPAQGIVAEFNGYGQAMCIAGWFWSAAWLLTSPRLSRRAARSQA